jgi:phosphomethylpyrimidine synthase
MTVSGFPYAMHKTIPRTVEPLFRFALIEQMEQGVDLISVHAAMKRKHLRMISHRLMGIVSHAGKILAEWMDIHKEENFPNTHFPEICEIACTYDAATPPGSGLRPGSIYDANDRT